MKKLLSLLLALVMLFSLAACTASGKDDDDKDETEKTEQSDSEKDAEKADEQEPELDLDKDLVRYAESYADFIRADPDMDTATFLKLTSPALKHQDLTELLGFFYGIGAYSEEQFLTDMKVTQAQETLRDAYADDFTVTTKVTDAVPYTDDELESLRSDVASIAEGYARGVADADGATEADWADMAAQDGVSVETEKRAYELLRLIAEELADAEITEAYKLTIRNTFEASNLDEPSERVGSIVVVRVNGTWMLLDGLAAYSMISY